MVVGVLIGFLVLILSSVANYIRFSERIELFVAKEEAQAQTA